MITPDVLNYFLIVLGGFGVIWGYRSIRRKKEISEFEYAAFSTIWGIPLFAFFTWLLRDRADLMEAILKTPMVATPTLFLLGASIGASYAYISGWLWSKRPR